MSRSLFVVIAVLSGGCDTFISPATRVQRADAAIAAGDHRAALVELRNALKKDPSLPQAHLLLAESLLWLGDAPGAEREVARAEGVADVARRADVAIRIALALGRYEDVIQRLEAEAPALAPGKRELYRGTALLQLRRPDDARLQFEAAIAANPALIAARTGALEAQLIDGDRNQAIASLAGLTVKYPESATAWFSYGAALAASGDSKRAVTALARANELAPRQLDVLRQATLLAALAETNLLERNLDAARVASASLNRLAPDAPVSLFIASRIEMAANNYPAAVATLRRLAKEVPTFLQARLLLAMGLIAQGNLEQASAELNALIAQEPAHVGARQMLAQVRMRLDDPDGALRLLVPALEAEAEGQQINAMIDSARSKLGAGQSVALLEQMLAEEPGNRALQSQLASAYLQAGAPDKAAALLRGSGDDGGSTDQRRAVLLLRAIEEAEGSAVARAKVDTMIAANPANPYVVNLAAAFYAHAGDFDAGRRVLERALQRGVAPGTVLFALAQLEWSGGKRAAAAAALNRLLQLQPDNAVAHMAAGEIALASGDVAGARRHFEAVRADRPESIDARLRLAQLMLAQGESKQADEAIAGVLKLAAQRPEVRNSIGTLLLNSGRADQALEHFRAATEAAPANPLGWLNFGRAQRALGQDAAARESLQRALAAQPRWLPAEAALVAMDVEARKPEDALARVKALKAAAPRDPAILALEGDVYAVTQRYAEADAAYLAAYNMRPAGALAVKIYRSRIAGQLKAPAELLERWLAAHPGDVSIRVIVAEEAMRTRDHPRAIEQYRAVLEVRPADVIALNNLAWLYQEAGDPRALALAREAARLAPQSAAVGDTLGWMLVQNGQVDEGLKILQVAVGQKGANEETQYHYAAALARNGSLDEARTRLQQLLREPGQFPSRTEAERLLSQLSAPKKAS